MIVVDTVKVKARYLERKGSFNFEKLIIFTPQMF